MVDPIKKVISILDLMKIKTKPLKSFDARAIADIDKFILWPIQRPWRPK
jgi:hypothetical protein